ncbi:hypothetical protein [uncultured Desulfovibrio sp.]|uniref:hypothetical protein n=1 Tax=uncultured Desulfovibrio sp. TaxID=167968 RepID=UPI00260AFD21|nr:hypothetical protein [uncultured Desulfovibrio sp.]
MESIFKECCDFIDTEYKRLGHMLGYRFLLCPQKLLNPQTKILYLGLNTGGKEEISEHSCTSCEYGTAFFTESWKGMAPGTENLQRQTQFLFGKLQRNLGVNGTIQEFSDSYVLSAYFIPFRSPSWTSLCKKKESIESANNLWSKIFDYWMPNHIIALGKDTYKQIEKLFLQHNFDASPIQLIPSGWGKYNLAVRIFFREGRTIYLGNLLHLSQFKIMGKIKYAYAIDTFLDMMHFG